MPTAIKSIESAKVLAGGRRALAEFARADQRQIVITGDVAATLAAIEAALNDNEVTVMVSGDPGYYSLLPALNARFGERVGEVVPGVSSLQVAFARLKMPWQNATLLSFHGREPDRDALNFAPGKIIGALTDSRNNSQAIAELLLKCGWPKNSSCHIALRLSYPEEKIIDTDLQGASIGEPISHGVIIVSDKSNKEVNKNRIVGELFACRRAEAEFEAKHQHIGIADGEFYRGKIPMTKEEVRILTIAKARISPGDTVYDIGAGTGSLTVEAARQAWRGKVYAWEKNPEGVKLIEANGRKFGAENISIIAADAPEKMTETPAADAVIIGGSGGKLAEILAAADKKLKPGGRIVLNFVTVQNLAQAIEFMRAAKNYRYETCQMQVSRWRQVGRYDMGEGQNPVYIMTCVKEMD